MQRHFLVIVVLLLLAAGSFSISAEEGSGLDPAIAKLLKRYAPVCVGVNVLDETDIEQPESLWTPGVRIGDGDILLSSELLPLNVTNLKFTMQQGKTRARCDFKAINERSNIALIRPGSSVSGGLSFAGDTDFSIGTKLYVLNCLNPETGFLPEIVPFHITAKIDLTSGKLFVTDLIYPTSADPRYIGCPVFDSEAKVVGLINALSADETRTMVLFPNSYVRTAVNKAINPKDTSLKKCWFGAFTKELTPEWLEKLNLPTDVQGALIEDVIKGSPAANAGLKSLDIVIDINGVPINGPDARDLNSYFSNNFRPNDEVVLNVFRDNARLPITVKLLERPTSVFEAPSYIDDKIGIEVRDLTTDMRLSLGIDQNAAGVLVRDLTSRKPFHVGLSRTLGVSFTIRNGVVIEKVNGKEVKSADEFKAQIDAVRSKKEKVVTLFVRYNKSGEKGCINTVFVRIELED